ncbi:10066_t:CDS:2, partial [Scutellospora calospora]
CRIEEVLDYGKENHAKGKDTGNNNQQSQEKFGNYPDPTPFSPLSPDDRQPKPTSSSPDNNSEPKPKISSSSQLEKTYKKNFFKRGTESLISLFLEENEPKLFEKSEQYPLLITLSANWVGHSLQLRETINELLKEKKDLLFLEIDTDFEHLLSTRLGVDRIPISLLFFKEKIISGPRAGAMSLARLKEFVNSTVDRNLSEITEEEKIIANLTEEKATYQELLRNNELESQNLRLELEEAKKTITILETARDDSVALEQARKNKEQAQSEAPDSGQLKQNYNLLFEHNNTILSLRREIKEKDAEITQLREDIETAEQLEEQEFQE